MATQFFSGAGGYAYGSTNFNTQKICISVWLKLNHINIGDGAYVYVFAKDYDFALQHEYWFNDKLYLTTGGVTQGLNKKTYALPQIGVWTHFFMVFDNSASPWIKLYINGELATPISTPNTADVSANTFNNNTTQEINGWEGGRVGPYSMDDITYFVGGIPTDGEIFEIASGRPAREVRPDLVWLSLPTEGDTGWIFRGSHPNYPQSPEPWGSYINSPSNWSWGGGQGRDDDAPYQDALFAKIGLAQKGIAPSAASTTGTGAITFGALVSTGTATVQDTAAGTVTLGEVTGTGSTTTQITASGAITLGDATSTGSVTVSIAASGAITLGDLTSTGAVTTVAGATGDITFGVLTSTGSGTGANTANGDVTLGELTSTGTGIVTVTGTGDITLGALTGTSATTVPITGSGAITLGDLTSAGAAGPTPTTGTGSGVLDPLTSTGSATVLDTATGAVTLGALTSTGAAATQIGATGAVTLGVLTGSGAAITQAGAVGNVTLGALTGTGSAIGSTDLEATGAVTLGTLTGSGSATVKTTASGAATMSAMLASGMVTVKVTVTGAKTLGAMLASGSGITQTGASGAITFGLLTSTAAGTAAFPTGAVHYGRAFVLGNDQRLRDAVTAIEATFGSMVDLYVVTVYDIMRWIDDHLTAAGQVTANAILDTIYPGPGTGVAILYGKAFVESRDQRLKDVVATLETAYGPFPDLYVQVIHDVVRFIQVNLSPVDLAAAYVIINAAYGSTYTASETY